MRPGLVEEFWRLARFSTVGGLATIVHIGVAMVAVAAAAANPTVGAMMGFVAAAPGRYRDYLPKFSVSALASFFLSTGAVWVATAIFGIDYKPALIALAIIVPVCNYFVNRFWVFFQPGGGPGRPLEIVTPE